MVTRESQDGRLREQRETVILALMEAASITGPAKNLLGFCKWIQSADGRKTGLRVVVATFSRADGASSCDGFAKAARAAGVETHIIRERHRFDTRVFGQLRKIVDIVRPDVIQTHNGKSHLMLGIAPKLRAGRPWIAFQHGYQDTDLKLRVYNQLDRLSLRLADRVVSVCEAFAPRLTQFGVQREKIRVLHNSAVPTPTAPAANRDAVRRDLGVSDGVTVILSIGRLSREKGHATLLRAASRLSLPRWKLVLVGEGPERPNLVQLAESLGISASVEFAGFHSDVSRFYAAADLFVLPSHSEGSSNVLLEAMMAGVPIVATDAGGNRELVVDEVSGLLVPVLDPEALTVAIARVAGSAEMSQRLASAALQRASREFSVDQYRVRLTAFYAEALSDIRAPRGTALSP
jgi:glycosyltransferase involved in cell wall biosynthesis